MTDMSMPQAETVSGSDSALLRVVAFEKPPQQSKYIDHKHIAAVGDSILRLNTSEFKAMCRDILSLSGATGVTPAAVEDCMFAFANLIIEESKSS